MFTLTKQSIQVSSRKFISYMQKPWALHTAQCYMVCTCLYFSLLRHSQYPTRGFARGTCWVDTTDCLLQQTTRWQSSFSSYCSLHHCASSSMGIGWLIVARYSTMYGHIRCLLQLKWNPSTILLSGFASRRHFCSSASWLYYGSQWLCSSPWSSASG